MRMRNREHPVLGKLDRKTINFTFNGKRLQGCEGDSIASALLANGIRTIRHDLATREPRGIFCGIGHCYECRVNVKDEGNARACITPIAENMTIESTRGEDNEI